MAKKAEITEKVETKTTTKAKVVEDDGMEDIFIPIDYSNPDEMTEYIAVNGVAQLIPKGQKVRVKREFALAWQNTQAERDKQFQKAEEQRLRDMEHAQGHINSTY